MPLTRHHATAFLGPPGSGCVLEELRRTWDPEMARQIRAHITFVYPEEIPGPAELAARARLAAARTAPFTIALGPPFHVGSPADGVFDARFTITQVTITAYDGNCWPTLETISLTVL